MDEGDEDTPADARMMGGDVESGRGVAGGGGGGGGVVVSAAPPVHPVRSNLLASSAAETKKDQKDKNIKVRARHKNSSG